MSTLATRHPAIDNFSMGATDTSKFESGLIGWFVKWRGFLALLCTMLTLSFGGFRHINSMEIAIDRLSAKLEDFDRRIPAIEAASMRDREAVVRMEVQIAGMAEILRRIEAKIDSKHP